MGWKRDPGRGGLWKQPGLEEEAAAWARVVCSVGSPQVVKYERSSATIPIRRSAPLHLITLSLGLAQFWNKTGAVWGRDKGSTADGQRRYCAFAL